MEGGASNVGNPESATATTSSYTYWVRKENKDAAPLPVPRKLTPQDLHNSNSNHLGSAWNQVFIYIYMYMYLLSPLVFKENRLKKLLVKTIVTHIHLFSNVNV